MTKTLTEQWRDGTLPEGWYYVKKWDYEISMLYFEGDYFLDTDVPLSNGYIKEVLAPVPSYDEFVQQRDFVKDHQKVLIENMNLKRKLEIATKALKEYADITNWIEGNFMCVCDGNCFSDEESAEQALKEMEGVK